MRPGDDFQAAGGRAVAGPGLRILDIEPSAIHQRTAVILGGADQVDALLKHLESLRPNVK